VVFDRRSNAPLVGEGTRFEQTTTPGRGLAVTLLHA
jgi:hypothetical protein